MSPQETPRVRLLAVLLFFSGASALICQMVWVRQFRLVFGGTTPAAAAVLAVYMGCLGVGGWWFGRKVGAMERHLRAYGQVEVLIGLTAAATPWLLGMTRAAYITTGGVVSMGSAMATVIQVLLAVVVLSVPSFLMGGTLPLVAQCVGSDDDGPRGRTGFIYGMNALGAVFGVLASTFWLLEFVGLRGSLWLAAGGNLLVGLTAIAVASRWSTEPDRVRHALAIPTAGSDGIGVSSPENVLPGFIPGAAFLFGFVFFLLELVWFRLSAPLLGSSTYNFGLILAIALFGIGVGGLCYRAWAARPSESEPSLGGLGLVTCLSAFVLIVPYALGDRLALMALFTNEWRSFGFGGQLLSWILIGAILVLLPSVLAGFQFPLLVAIRGRGRNEVGRHLGNAYAWNTAGAVAGSLLGGFVLIPSLTAPGCWRLASWLLLLLAAVAMWLGRRRMSRTMSLAGVGIGAFVLLFSLRCTGPTAAWRHSPIGYGRIESLPRSPNGQREWIQVGRWRMRREIEGREASLAVLSSSGYELQINGKTDGSGIPDAPTQIMSVLLGAMIHPGPTSACVVGLRTGSSAGWLAEVPGMQRVDVVEIEPGVVQFARDEFAAVNRDVMRKTNVHVIVGDAREVLLARGRSYDLIASEPSNPYRAGISSMYTREYYQAIRGRQNEGGIFCQWMQGDEIDARTFQLVYGTLSSVFPQVEVWATKTEDMLLLAHGRPPGYTAKQLRQRLAIQPYMEAVRKVWFTDFIEGVLAYHLVFFVIAEFITGRLSRVNTDDRNELEYGFARSLLRENPFEPLELLALAQRQGADVPASLGGEVDLDRVREERLLVQAAEMLPISVTGEGGSNALARAQAMAA